MRMRPRLSQYGPGRRLPKVWVRRRVDYQNFWFDLFHAIYCMFVFKKRVCFSGIYFMCLICVRFGPVSNAFLFKMFKNLNPLRIRKTNLFSTRPIS